MTQNNDTCTTEKVVYDMTMLTSQPRKSSHFVQSYKVTDIYTKNKSCFHYVNFVLGV